MRYYTRISGRSGVSVGCFGMILTGFAWLLVIALLIHFWYIVAGVVLALLGLGMLRESRRRRRQPPSPGRPAKAKPAQPAKPEGPRDWEPTS